MLTSEEREEKGKHRKVAEPPVTMALGGPISDKIRASEQAKQRVNQPE